MSGTLEFRHGLLASYPDVYTAAARTALAALAPLNRDRRRIMDERIARRRERAVHGRRLDFLAARRAHSAHRRSACSDAREGRFTGSEIPARPRAPVDPGNRARHPAARHGRERPAQRRLRAALRRRRLDVRRRGRARAGRHDVARQPAQPQAGLRRGADLPAGRRGGRRRDERLGAGLPRAGRSFDDWRRQLDFTTRIFRPRGLHLDDRHVREADGTGFSASIVDLVLYVVNNRERLQAEGRSIVLYLPKIQTAEEAALWNDMLAALERHLGLPVGHDQGLRARRADRGLLPADGDPRRARRRTSSASTPAAGTTSTASPTRSPGTRRSSTPTSTRSRMTYGYMRRYEDRVRRAVNTPDRDGRCALWQGGMEANIPVGSAAGVAAGMKRAVAGGEREQREGASGKWVAHWKMVHDRAARSGSGPAPTTSSAAPFPRLTYTRGGRRRPDAARAGAAHRPRRARPALASRCSTATPSARASRPRRSSPPTSSATTTCST